MIHFEKKLASIDSLPTLPMVANKLLEMLKDDKMSMKFISNIMKNDPSITAKVLKVSNSAHYGLRNRIDTLKMALVVLGVNEVTSIILGLSVFKTFDKVKSNDEFDVKSFWIHSIQTAYIAKFINDKLKMKSHGEEFTAGLIHDIGKIIIFNFFPDEFNEINDKIKLFPNKEGYLFEANIFGAPHMKIGAWLATKWKLPLNLIEAISYHHHPFQATAYKQLVSIINIANYYSSALEKDELKCDFSEFKALEGWKTLKFDKKLILEGDFYQELRTEKDKSQQFLSSLMSVL